MPGNTFCKCRITLGLCCTSVNIKNANPERLSSTASRMSRVRAHRARASSNLRHPYTPARRHPFLAIAVQGKEVRKTTPPQGGDAGAVVVLQKTTPRAPAVIRGRDCAAFSDRPQTQPTEKERAMNRNERCLCTALSALAAATLLPPADAVEGRKPSALPGRLRRILSGGVVEPGAITAQQRVTTRPQGLRILRSWGPRSGGLGRSRTS